MRLTIQADEPTRLAMMETLRDLMAVQNENIRAIARKRSWRDSEKAMAAAKYTKRIEHLAVLHEALRSLK